MIDALNRRLGKGVAKVRENVIRDLAGSFLQPLHPQCFLEVHSWLARYQTLTVMPHIETCSFP
jgi:hypothetical protein